MTSFTTLAPPIPSKSLNSPLSTSKPAKPKVGSIAMAIATGGLNLGFTALAARNMKAATRKLDIIEAELNRRGVPPREISKGDVFTIFIGSVVAAAIGANAQAAASSDAMGVAAVQIDTSLHGVIQARINAAPNASVRETISWQFQFGW